MNWQEAKKHEVFSTLTGSRLYGTSRPDSDIDIRGVFIGLPLASTTCTLTNPDGSDESICEIREFVRLAAAGDQQKIEMLYAANVPGSIQLLDREHFGPLLGIRATFLSEQWVNKLMGYVRAVLHRVNGRHPLDELSADIAHCVRVLHVFKNYLNSGTFSPRLSDKDVIDEIRLIKSKQADNLYLSGVVEHIRIVYDALKERNVVLPPVDMNKVQAALFQCLSTYWSKTLAKPKRTTGEGSIDIDPYSVFGCRDEASSS